MLTPACAGGALAAAQEAGRPPRHRHQVLRDGLEVGGSCTGQPGSSLWCAGACSTRCCSATGPGASGTNPGSGTFAIAGNNMQYHLAEMYAGVVLMFTE